MQIRNLVTDDSAVSPVIGVILMVAITVILAAVIGTFVLGIGQDQQTTPSATFDFEYNSSSNVVTVTHAGGDSFTSDNSNEVTVTHNGSEYAWLSNQDPIDAGKSVTVASGSGDVTTAPVSGETVRVIWSAPGGDKTNTVGSFEVP